MTKFFPKQHKINHPVLRPRATGFTLVETLVAISIFTVALIALMGVLAKGISNTAYAKQADTAAYLAQEGVEYMRNLRDTYMLYSATAQNGWDAFNSKLSTNSCTSLPNGCYFNADGLFTFLQPMPMTQIQFNSCGTTCTSLTYDSSTGAFGYSSPVNSGFSRRITAKVVNPNETDITSTVYWSQGSGTYNFSFTENLFNWIQ